VYSPCLLVGLVSATHDLIKPTGYIIEYRLMKFV